MASDDRLQLWLNTLRELINDVNQCKFVPSGRECPMKHRLEATARGVEYLLSKQEGKVVNIEVKDEDVLHGLMQYRFDPMLCRIVRWIAQEWGRIVITEGYRQKRHNNDLHGEIPVRAVDLRSRIYMKPEMVADKINSEWQYDYQRPDMQVCVYHDSGEGKHFHVQTHPNTRRR